MINGCKEITLIDLSNDEYLEKLVLAIKTKKPILKFQFAENLQLEFNFLDVWHILFSEADTSAQREYKELLNSSGYIPVLQISHIADKHQSINAKFLNYLIYDCYSLNYDVGGGASYKYLI